MWHKIIWISIPILFIIIYIIYAIFRPMPILIPSISIPQNNTTTSISPPNFAWPQSGQQAIKLDGYSLLATNGEQKQVPIASIAKVMVALAVLEKKPLNIGEQGPEIIITSDNEALYIKYLNQGQSVVPVMAGVNINEYQALQGLLLPSGNNMSNILAIWAFGSEQAYLDFANSYAKKLGMQNTNFADTSGYSPNTVSTPQDLLILGENALQNPVIAEVVNQKSAVVPGAGTIANTNIDLGVNGINGIKTGHTSEAGGCLLFSAQVNSKTIVGVILGDQSIQSALASAPELVNSFANNTNIIQPVTKNQIIATYYVPWMGNVDAVSSKAIDIGVWQNTQPSINTDLKQIKPNNYFNKDAGLVTTSYDSQQISSPVILSKAITKPNIWWRLSHPI